MMPTCIACDVDDILFEFYAAFALFHNKYYDSNFCKKDFDSYMIHEVCGGTVEDARHKVGRFYAADEFPYLPLVDGAVDTVPLLAEKYELFAVTGRPRGLQLLTEKMINQHFAGCFVGIHCTDAFGVGGDIPRPKVEVCREIGATIIIEDHLGHAIPCAEAGMHVILFDQPWNRKPIYYEGRIDRVHSWDEILALL